jgi:uncharacterized protein (DUF1697 family)
MPERQYVALLRGINVGGSNVIKMVDLKACFEEMGFADVATYIQSGNVLFRRPAGNDKKLTASIEKRLSQRFGYKSRVVVRSHERLKRAVKDAPRGFGKDPARFRYDVIFLTEPLKPAAAMKSISLKEGVDQAWAGKDVLYFARLTERATSSRLSRVVQLPIYQDMTIRNWNTTVKLLALMDARAAG